MEIFIAIIIITLPILAYYVGLYFSRGFHKGKRESIERIINTELEKSEQKELDHAE